MFCRRCGTWMADGAEFCPSCGTRLAAVVPDARRTVVPGRTEGVIGALLLGSALVLFVGRTCAVVPDVLSVLPFYEASLAAMGTAIFSTVAFLLSVICALGLRSLVCAIHSRSLRGSGPLTRAAVASAVLILLCLGLLASVAALGGTGVGSERVEVVRQALLPHWDTALYGLVPLVAALVVLCLGRGKARRAAR